MESLRIEIANPKAKRQINSMADMNLIRIKKEKTKSEFIELLTRLRKHSGNAPTLEEITSEVETDRISRYDSLKK